MGKNKSTKKQQKKTMSVTNGMPDVQSSTRANPALTTDKATELERGKQIFFSENQDEIVKIALELKEKEEQNNNNSFSHLLAVFGIVFGLLVAYYTLLSERCYFPIGETFRVTFFGWFFLIVSVIFAFVFRYVSTKSKVQGTDILLDLVEAFNSRRNDADESCSVQKSRRLPNVQGGKRKESSKRLFLGLTYFFLVLSILSYFLTSFLIFHSIENTVESIRSEIANDKNLWDLRNDITYLKVDLDDIFNDMQKSASRIQEEYDDIRRSRDLDDLLRHGSHSGLINYLYQAEKDFSQYSVKLSECKTRLLSIKSRDKRLGDELAIHFNNVYVDPHEFDPIIKYLQMEISKKIEDLDSKYEEVSARYQNGISSIISSRERLRKKE